MAQYQVGERVTCPHCNTIVRLEHPTSTSGVTAAKYFGESEDVVVTATFCPSCKRIIVDLEIEGKGSEKYQQELVAWPITGGRAPVPSEVPDAIAQDYREAASVLHLSPKASAALSRRCLQAVLRDKGYTQHDLSKQIEAVLPTLPSALRDNVDAIRHVGNFAAHAQKDTNSGAILDVEPEEAEWNLDVLDDLFDFYYVEPAKAQQRRAALNAKLQQAGKLPMK